MSRVILDIETVGFPFDRFDEVQQDYLLRFAKTEAEKEEALQKLSLYPTTAQVVAIGMFNPDTQHGKILFQDQRQESVVAPDGMVEYVSGDERTLLEQFWRDITHYKQFVTFNGRGFDCPFLMLRSAILGVSPSKNLMPYRYDATIHCDLLEQFTFYGAFRKFNLDFYCKAFGIVSPKSHGVTGLDLGSLFKDGRYREIAEYCLGDLKATAELFLRWEKFLNV